MKPVSFKSLIKNEPQHNNTNKMTCSPSKDSDQPVHLHILFRVFAVHSEDSQGPKASSCGQRRLCSDWANAQADLKVRLVHRSFCWFCHAVARIAGLRENQGNSKDSDELAYVCSLT